MTTDPRDHEATHEALLDAVADAALQGGPPDVLVNSDGVHVVDSAEGRKLGAHIQSEARSAGVSLPVVVGRRAGMTHAAALRTVTPLDPIGPRIVSPHDDDRERSAQRTMAIAMARHAAKPGRSLMRAGAIFAALAQPDPEARHVAEIVAWPA